MAWIDFKEDKIRDNTEAKKPIYRGIGSGKLYSILRIGRKYKTLGQIKGFLCHMDRTKNTPNADTTLRRNELIIGNTDLVSDVKNYISDCKYVKPDTNIAREMLLTASPDFFRGLSKQDFDKWVDINRQWLKKQFGDNVRYAVLHLDETTCHLHILCVPKMYNEKRKCYVLSHEHYFGGKDRFKEYQDIYAIEMQNTFKGLSRGIKGSKAKHVNIKQYYSLVNKNLNENDLDQIKAKAKNSELLELKLKQMENTVEVYKKALEREKNKDKYAKLGKVAQKDNEIER